MAGEKILLVDDEAHIRDLARLYLEKEGFQVRMATNGVEALARVSESPPALVVLDLMMPEMDGWEVCRHLRATSNLPILMLTARDDDIDKIVGLELGADDYMTKPYNPRELVARVKAVLRRGRVQPSPAAEPAALRAGPLTIDPARREVHLGDQPLDLRTKEFDLLQVFVENEGLALSREKLLDLAWGFDFYGETRTVDVHVAHLRDRLKEADSLRIETVWGVGYKMVVDE